MTDNPSNLGKYVTADTGKTQTYFPWDSWDHPYTTIPEVWFHDLLRPEGWPYEGSEMDAIDGLTGLSGRRVQSC